MGEEFCQDLLRFRQDWGGGVVTCQFLVARLESRLWKDPFGLQAPLHPLCGLRVPDVLDAQNKAVVKSRAKVTDLVLSLVELGKCRDMRPTQVGLSQKSSEGPEEPSTLSGSTVRLAGELLIPKDM